MNSSCVGAFTKLTGVIVPGPPTTSNNTWKITVESATVTPEKVGSSQEKVNLPAATCATPKFAKFKLGKPKLCTVL